MATILQSRPLRRGSMNQQGALYDFLFNVKELINTAFPNAGLSLEASAAPSSPSSIVLSGITGNTASLRYYQTSVTVANGQTVGDEASITAPAYFTPLWLLYHVTTASTNVVALVDVGTAGDADGYVDGITSGASLATTGFKGLVACNGTLGGGDITGGVTSNTTPDETRITVSGDPGATGVVIRLTFIGLIAT